MAVGGPTPHHIGNGMAAGAGALLALLEEPAPELKVHALRSLLAVVDTHWAEIAGAISQVESLYEDPAFPQREVAALLASKVFYHLGELGDALTYALGAGALFDVSAPTDYARTLVARCIDVYVASRPAGEPPAGDAPPTPPLDPRLSAIVDRLLERCLAEGAGAAVVGVALESGRTDLLTAAVARSRDRPGLLAHAMRASQALVGSRADRQAVLRALVGLYAAEPAGSVDHVALATARLFLDDAPGVAAQLESLVGGTADDCLLAYQVAFDLRECEAQHFLARVLAILAPPPPVVVTPPAAPAAPEGGTAMETDGTAAGGGAAPPAPIPAPPPPTPAEVTRATRLTKLVSILTGEVPTRLHLEFLHGRNKSDLGVLRAIKAAVEPRNSVAHAAAVCANALMHAGTTVDTFLRENLDWLARALNWAKFGATAGLGVIHRGHVSASRTLMGPYLPRPGGGPSSSPYSEGGALYALGLIHASHGAGVSDFLLDSLRGATHEVVQHGACLGLGLATLGLGESAHGGAAYEALNTVLYTDSAVGGEAAGLAMGLLLAGTGSAKVAEMLAYAHDTQHEKIIRGLAMGAALSVYGREEAAESVIQQMARDGDPLLRAGGCYAVGLAFRATASNAAVRRLLHAAVSDVSDDVRRAAVTNLGLVLCASGDQCPKVVGLLAESYNPHVRYGAALAVGIACAATGMESALALLEPLSADGVDFVRQGALIATAMVLLQQPEAPRVAAFRKTLSRVTADKHEETLAKMGAIMAAGILDAGGRNATLRLRSRAGHPRMSAIVGLAVFTGYWYWYPLSYFLSLALSPTALIALDGDLAMPKLAITSAAKPSLYAYPSAAAAAATGPAAKAPAAVLSTTARAKAKGKKDAAEKAASLLAAAVASGVVAMEAESPATAATTAAPKDKGLGKDASPLEQDWEALHNPARVVPAQERCIKWAAPAAAADGSATPVPLRWAPLLAASSGIIMLRDLTPGVPYELVAVGGPGGAPAAAPAAAAAPEEDEPAPPAPFVYAPS